MNFRFVSVPRSSPRPIYTPQGQWNSAQSIMGWQSLLWASDPQDESQKQQQQQQQQKGQTQQKDQTTDKQTRDQWHWPAASSDPPRDWNKSLNATDWAAFKETRTLIPTVILTGSILALVRLRRRFRRFPDASSISPAFIRKRSLFGRVTSVGDGDNFRMYHTPGGKLAGWGWLPWKKVPTSKKDLKDKTVASASFFLPVLILTIE